MSSHEIFDTHIKKGDGLFDILNQVYLHDKWYLTKMEKGEKANKK